MIDNCFRFGEEMRTLNFFFFPLNAIANRKVVLGERLEASTVVVCFPGVPCLQLYLWLIPVVVHPYLFCVCQHEAGISVIYRTSN